MEGFELSVLQGATQTLEQCHPVLYLEAQRALPGVRTATTEVLAYLDKRGYSCFWDVKHYVADKVNAFRFEAEARSDLALVTQNVLCLPRGGSQPPRALARFPVSMDGRESGDDICEASAMFQGAQL